MDRRRPRTFKLGLLIAALAGSALAQSGATALRAQRWLAPQTDAAQVLSREPTECLIVPADPQARLSVEIGRAAFRNPLILGGQAARAGLACESCHRSGRTNRDFAFPGVSGAPGTADVTSSLFSSRRGDGIFNPKPIPDLSSAKAGLKISQGRDDRALERFIHGLVTEEFDGHEPPVAVQNGLADYVRALSPTACPDSAMQPVTAAGLIADSRRAMASAQTLAERGDQAAAGVMVQAARARLFLVDERFSAAALSDRRALIRRADRRLEQIAEHMRSRAPTSGTEISDWIADSREWEAKVNGGERLSLFNRQRLAAAAHGTLPRAPS